MKKIATAAAHTLHTQKDNSNTCRRLGILSANCTNKQTPLQKSSSECHPAETKPTLPQTPAALLNTGGTGGITIAASTEPAEYLSFRLDQEPGLDFHRTNTAEKAKKSLEALRSLSGSTQGSSVTTMRRVYRAVVLLQILCGASLWWQPQMREQSRHLVSPFNSAQKQAACLISGAFCTTTPMWIQIDEINKCASVRICLGPNFAIPKLMITERAPGWRWFVWTMMEEQG
ncbi:hypothetical protein N7456_012549 [Penicillium angulare]|uniref:Uncharacterized protein n=1 Tax=Penicillium angulare TaxID=116970 RepID=A0A9W9EJV0_9EURO|nr:hypothetical protein N7456_012549 [Penicillium angulare]